MSWLPSTGDDDARIVVLFSGCMTMLGIALGVLLVIFWQAWRHT